MSPDQNLEVSKMLTRILEEATRQLPVAGLVFAVQVPDGVEVSVMAPYSVSPKLVAQVLLPMLRDVIDTEIQKLESVFGMDDELPN